MEEGNIVDVRIQQASQPDNYVGFAEFNDRNV